MLASRLLKRPIYDNTIEREEVHTYYPHTKSFGYNDTIEISINQEDALMKLAESYLEIEGKITPDAGGQGECKLTNNAGVSLFNNASYELNMHQIQSVREPGILTTIRSYCLLTPSESKGFSTAGWSPTEPIVEKDGKFFMYIPLSYVFSVFQDYQEPIIGKHVFRFTRAANDNNCYQSVIVSDAGIKSEGTKRAKIEIINMALKVKHQHPDMTNKLQIMTEIAKETPFFIPFMKWDIYEKPNLADSTQDLWSVKTVSSVERPRFIIIAFQSDRKNSPIKDSNDFDHLDMTSMKLYLNSDAYPFENWRLNFGQLRYTEAYQAYLDFQRTFRRKSFSEPLLDYSAFKDHAFFIFDCSKHAVPINSSPAVDIKIEFESSKNFPANTRAYCVIIHDSVFTYTQATGNVQQMVE